MAVPKQQKQHRNNRTARAQRHHDGVHARACACHAGGGCSWLTAVRAALVLVSGYFAKTTLLASPAESRGGSWHCPRGMNWVRRHETSCK